MRETLTYYVPRMLMAIGVIMAIFMLTGCGANEPPILGEYNVTGTGGETTCGGGSVANDFSALWVVADADMKEFGQGHPYYLFPLVEPTWVMTSDDGERYDVTYIDDFFGCIIQYDYSANLKEKLTETKQMLTGPFSIHLLVLQGCEPFECKANWDVVATRTIKRG